MLERTDGEPWCRDGADVAAQLGTHLATGLTAAQVAAAFERYGPNALDVKSPVPAWRKLLAQLADPLVYLLLAAVLVSFIAWVLEGRHGVPFDGIVIIAIIVANAALGYGQQARAEGAVAALQRMTAATARVRRDGLELRLDSTEIVPGDVLVLAEGDSVTADARLIEAAALSVAEASLTGESEPVVKSVAALDGPVSLGDRVNMVFSGTAVVRGRGIAVVTETGMSTEIGRVAGMLGRTESERTPLQREVDRIGRTLGIAVTLIALVVVAAIMLTTEITAVADVIDVLILGVSLAVAAVPEGLPAILSVVLALGVQRLARQRAIVKRMSAVETLGSASVVCSDKTGTLTKNEMTIQTVVTCSGELEVTGTGYRPVGAVLRDGIPLRDPDAEDEVRLVLGGGSLASDATLSEADGVWTIGGDPTEAAFLVAEAKIGLTDARMARYRRVGEIPFTAERKLMTTLNADRLGGEQVIAVTKGAPDVLLTRCNGERAAGNVCALTDARRAELAETVDRLADRALRVLAVAYKVLPSADFLSDDVEIESNLILLGLVGMIDAPRPEARAAIAEAQGAGIRIAMITGDHPRTAARIAGDLGILGDTGEVMTGTDVEALDDDGLREAVRTVSVFARVAPEHKLRLVKALQAERHVVAMTGDGVNDAPALKAADIGVAMAMTGTDVTKEAADMILADDNFATIITAVREGRAILANIRKFLRFLLSSNIGEVLTMFFGVLFAGALGLERAGETLSVPLLATQILWINLLTDTAPALAMGLDPPAEDLMQRPPRHLDDRVIDRSMWIGVIWVGVVMAASTLAALDLGLRGGLLGGSGTIVEARTMAITTLVFAQMFNAFNARSDRVSAFQGLFTNPALWAAVGFSCLLQVAMVQIAFMNRAFETSPLSAHEWLVCVGLASLVLWAAEGKKWVVRTMR